MHKFFIAFILLNAILFNTCLSQGLQFMTGYGIMNYEGDLQSKPFTFQQAQSAFSGSLKFPVKDQVIGRVGFVFGSVSANDKFNPSPQKERNLNFRSNIEEVQVLLEYHFLNNSASRFSPYVVGGLGVFHFNPYTRDDQQGRIFLKPLSTEGEGLPEYPDRKPYSLIQPSIPFGIGVNYELSCSFSIGLEFLQRKLFTDYLDDVSKGYIDYNTLLKERGPVATQLAYRAGPYPSDISTAYPRGNPKRKDWFYTGMINITYKLDNCVEQIHKINKKRSTIGCPIL